MNSIIGQAILAELATEYNSTIGYIESIPTCDTWHFNSMRHTVADRNNALGQLAALRSAMQIVARQTNVKVIFPY